MGPFQEPEFSTKLSEGAVAAIRAGRERRQREASRKAVLISGS
ncbi:hypothetical protein [Streptomyces chrestomyceticus]